MKRLIAFLTVAAVLLLAGCSPSAQELQATTAPVLSEQPTVAAPTLTEQTLPTQPHYPKADKCIALTFDDGPNRHMGQILDVFAEYGGKASFFVIGNRIDDQTDTYIQRAFEEGHEIGNHSYSHEDMTAKTQEDILREISSTQEAVEALTGTAPVWYRPPFMNTNAVTYLLIDMPHGGYGVSAKDGSNDISPEERCNNILSGAYDGAIALLHCNDITAQVLPQILEDLKMQGYEFVTVSELFQRANKVPDTGRLHKDNGT